MKSNLYTSQRYFIILFLSYFLHCTHLTHALDLNTINIPCGNKTESIGISLHLTKRDESIKAPQKLNQDKSWLKAQLKEANTLFSAIGVCFYYANSAELPQTESRMLTRKQRTHLGRLKGRLSKGQIDLFIVNYLGDVDIKDNEIRGVHWRDPRDKKYKRWIILSRIARTKVLAHELGHYFDLPHSKFAQSIMNKKPRKTPPMSERGFVASEYKIMKRAWLRMKKNDFLTPR